MRRFALEPLVLVEAAVVALAACPALAARVFSASDQFGETVAAHFAIHSAASFGVVLEEVQEN